MVPIEIERRILQLTVDRLVQFLRDPCARRLRPGKVPFQILDKNGQALSSETQFVRGEVLGPHLLHHDPGISRSHLGPADWIAVAVVFDEAKCLAEPGYRFVEVSVLDVRENRIDGY